MTQHEDEHAHPGPCMIGVGLLLAGTGRTGADLLREAADWGRGLPELAGHAASADLVLAVPLPRGAQAVSVTAEQRQDCAELLEEAAGYWSMCGYAEDAEDPDSQWLGETAGLGRGVAECALFVQVARNTRS